MSSDVKIPEWAFEVVDNMRVSREAIARALLAAEQRGRKAGLEEAYGAVKASRDMDGSTGLHWDLGYACAFSDALAAIRSLGEKT